MIAAVHRMSAPARDAVTSNAERAAATILVVADVEEIRVGIEHLLTADGYRIDLARSEADAIDRATRRRPSLVLLSLDAAPFELIAAATRIRQRARVGIEIPVVIFSVPTLAEGEEVAIGRNVHLTRPDNFNQLRRLMARLLAPAE
jgi:CheY-like chemotaxis protein